MYLHLDGGSTEGAETVYQETGQSMVALPGEVLQEELITLNRHVERNM